MGVVTGFDCCLYYAGVDHDELVKLAEKQFSGLRSTYEETDVPEPCRFTGSEVGKVLMFWKLKQISETTCAFLCAYLFHHS
jgi:predicted Zn-dependent peptidase